MPPVQDFLARCYRSLREQWYHIRQPLNQLPTPVRISLQCLLFSVVCCMTSGILLSLYFVPNPTLPRDEEGRILVTFSVVKDVIVTSGNKADTLFRLGEVVLLPIDHSTKKVLYPINDSSYFHRATQGGVLPSISWNSIEAISRNVLFGDLVRTLHQHSVTYLIFSIVSTISFWLYYQVYRSPHMLRWYSVLLLTGLVLFAAWSGSILPWSVRSEAGLRIVPTLIYDYLPFGKHIRSFLYNGDTLTELSYYRIFSLHTIYLPLFLSMLLLSIRRWIGYISWQLLASMLLLFVLSSSIFGIHSSESTQPFSVLLTPNHNTIYPEWYFAGITWLMSTLSEDIVVALLSILTMGLFILPVLDDNANSITMRFAALFKIFVVTALLVLLGIGLYVSQYLTSY